MKADVVLNIADVDLCLRAALRTRFPDLDVESICVMSWNTEVFRLDRDAPTTWIEPLHHRVLVEHATAFTLDKASDFPKV
jgi:hypothetical protein